MLEAHQKSNKTGEINIAVKLKDDKDTGSDRHQIVINLEINRCNSVNVVQIQIISLRNVSNIT